MCVCVCVCVCVCGWVGGWVGGVGVGMSTPALQICITLFSHSFGDSMRLNEHTPPTGTKQEYPDHLPDHLLQEGLKKVQD